MEEKTITVLLVEDDTRLRKLELAILQRSGFVSIVLEACNGEQAVELMGHNPENIDMLISDVILPFMDGIDVAEQFESRFRNRPTLLITGGTDILTNEERGRLENFFVLEKPFLPREFIRAVKSIWESVPKAKTA